MMLYVLLKDLHELHVVGFEKRCITSSQSLDITGPLVISFSMISKNSVRSGLK